MSACRAALLGDTESLCEGPEVCLAFLGYQLAHRLHHGNGRISRCGLQRNALVCVERGATPSLARLYRQTLSSMMFAVNRR